MLTVKQTLFIADKSDEEFFKTLQEFKEIEKSETKEKTETRKQEAHRSPAVHDLSKGHMII